METNVKAIELRDLWRRYKASGDLHARERLVVAYSPLVKYVSGRMASGLPAHVEESDLISYGLVGLISAIERFDTTFGLVARPPEDDDDVWAVELQPGRYMAFFEPWDSGEYDT